MKIFVQWARNNPNDLVNTDSSQWGNTQTKADPVGDVVLDPLLGIQSVGDSQLNNQPGWLVDLQCQGVSFGPCDHYAVVDLPDGSCQVIIWNDDALWYPAGWRYGDVWLFEPLQFDNKVNAINTKQSRLFYADVNVYAQYTANGTIPPPPFLRRWADFPMPAPGITKHGIWLSDAKQAAHYAAQTLHGWREWNT